MRMERYAPVRDVVRAGSVGYAGRALGRLARKVYNSYKQKSHSGYSERDEGTGAESGSKAITVQHDVVRTYKARKVNKRKLRRLRRSRKTYLRNKLSFLNAKVFRFTGNFVMTGLAGGQGIGIVPGIFTLFGRNTANSSWDDLYQMNNSSLSLQTQSNTYNPPVGVLSGTTKFAIKSAIMEMDFTNTGSTACIVEIFECIARRNVESDADTPGVNYTTGYEAGVLGSSAATNTSQYYTPFDDQVFCKKYKILNCKKVYLAPGAASDLMVKSKGFVFDPKKSLSGIGGASPFALPGRTRFWVVLATGSPEYNAGSPRFSASQISITNQRTYVAKQLDESIWTGTTTNR